MADYVRARMTAAKVGIGIALGGLITGLADRVRSDPPPPPGDALLAADHFMKISDLDNKLGTDQIKNGSLLYEDFKKHQVASYSKVQKLAAIADALKTGAQKLETSLKTDVIQGEGEVFTGVQDVSNGEIPKRLLAVPDLIAVSASWANIELPRVTVKNIGDDPLYIIWTDANGQHEEMLAVDKTIDLGFPSGTNLITAQVICTIDHWFTDLTVSRALEPGSADSARFVAHALANNG